MLSNFYHAQQLIEQHHAAAEKYAREAWKFQHLYRPTLLQKIVGIFKHRHITNVVTLASSNERKCKDCA